MRRHPLVIAVAIGVALAAANGLRPDRHTHTHAQPPAASPCQPRPSAVAEPGVVAPGAPTTVTLAVDFGGCPADGDSLHVVLVLDASSSMGADQRAALKRATDAFIDALDLAGHPNAEVGVVQFSNAAKVLCQLTNRSSQAKSCVAHLGAIGNSCIACGITAGAGVLRRGRSQSTDLATLREVLIVVADGENATGREPVLTAATQAKADGIEVFTVCLGPACDAAVLHAAATSPRHALAARVDLAVTLPLVFDRIRTDTAAGRLGRLRVTDTVAPGMTLVEASIAPPAASISPDKRTIVWDPAVVRLPHVTFRYTARVPAAPGSYGVDLGALAAFTDTLGGAGAFTFPIPRVEVVLNPPTLTPAPTSVVPTPPPLTPVPTPVEPAPCPRLSGRIPQAAIDGALADPSRVGGWNLPCRIGHPISPLNPPRRRLDLRNVNQPWHPVFNGLVFKCGCS